jgi:hypothetical protein
MSLFRLLRDYITALRAQTAATVEATAAANRALSDAAWERYRRNREQTIHQHGHGHAVGNASLSGAACE